MKKEYWVAVVVVIVFVGIIAWYLASPLFLDKSVNEVPLGEGTTVYSANFRDADSFHKVSGEARIVDMDDGRYLRLENFEATNGPDLKVYLSEDLDANSYVSLGELKGNVGNQNYDVPSDIDLERYDKVLIWCEQFSVLFGSAELQDSEAVTAI